MASSDDHLSQFRLDGKTAVVTGIGPGIGSHVARAFAAVGARVVANARSEARVEALVAEIKASGNDAVGVPGDIGSEAVIDRIVSAAVSTYGGADILFHNAAAGAGAPGTGNSLDLDDRTWHDAVSVNLFAPFRLAKRLVPVMVQQGQGSIINVLTTAAFTPVTTIPLAAYGSTKAGLAMLTRYLAKECGPSVRVNAICPGTIAADAESAQVRAGQPEWAPLLSGIPLGRVGYADETVGAALFLASAASSYVTGQVIFVDGGRVSAAS
jgi:NAD(P)-dependent dehydrogenase (short-subunit alcohol dehydrogenase family)